MPLGTPLLIFHQKGEMTMWDLLLKGAMVVDPLNHLEAIRDVAIENGVIAEVGID